MRIKPYSIQTEKNLSVIDIGFPYADELIVLIFVIFKHRQCVHMK